MNRCTWTCQTQLERGQLSYRWWGFLNSPYALMICWHQLWSSSRGRYDFMVSILCWIGSVLPCHISLAGDAFLSGVLQRHSSGGGAAVVEGAEDIRVGDTGLWGRCDLWRHPPFPPEWWEEGRPQHRWKTFGEISVSGFLASMWAFST